MTTAASKPWIETPLIKSDILSKAAGCKIFLKLENLQPGGSFKSRGIGNLCVSELRNAQQPNKVHFYSSSGGNAGIACVHAARSLGRPCTVVVPTSTKPAMISKIRAAGASNVVQHGATWRDADAYLRETVMKEAEAHGKQAVYAPPFDHPKVWEGNATMIDEIARQLKGLGETKPPDVVACSVGGGGLFIGVMQGISAQGLAWASTTILALETVGADSLSQSLEQGKQVTIPGIISIATSLGAVRVADKAFELAVEGRSSGRVKSVVLSDADAVLGCWNFANDVKMLVEPACGVVTALCYDGQLQKALGREVRPDESVVLIVCGGHNIDVPLLLEWKKHFAL